MKSRILGKTGLKINVVGLGGIPLQRVSPENAAQIIEGALKAGCNFIDTARGYTVSESLIGEALQGRRNEVILATKTMARDYEGARHEIETSLKDLKTGYIDLYQFHNVGSREQYEQIMGENGAYKAFMEAKEAGKIGHIGITSHNMDFLKEIIEEAPVETIQVPYNIVESQAGELLATAAVLNLGVIVMKPLAGGAIREGELALKYCLSNKKVTVVIPGMDSLEQVENNCRAGMEEIVLNDEEISSIEEIRAALAGRFCRRCGYCMPCPQGINIPAMFLFDAYYNRYNLKEWATERYQALEVKADSCIACGACEPKCPYDLPIMEMMRETAATFGEQ